MYWHFETLLLGMAVLLVVFLDGRHKLDRCRGRDRMFMMCIVLAIAVSAIDLADCVIADFCDIRGLKILTRSLSMAAGAAPVLSWLCYTASILYEYEPKPLSCALGAAFIAWGVDLLLVAANLWTGWLFSYDAQLRFVRGNLFLLPLLINIAASAASYTLLIARRSYLPDKGLNGYLLIFPIFIWVGEILQLTVPGWQTRLPCYAVALLMSYLFIQNQKSLSVVRRLASAADSDAMTGLLNRAASVRIIDRALAARRGGPCAYLVIDIDGLKQINDTLGHPAGDMAICKTAEILRESFRRTDTLARIGGDEFVAFMPEIGGRATLVRIVESTLKRFETLTVGLEADHILPLRCSIGATIAEGVTTRELLYSQADTSLYHSKRSGKYCFSIYTPDMQPPQRPGEA